MKNGDKKHIVIIGGGFGGLNAALILSHARYRITLIDRRNFHLFQPLLYQVASGGLSPADIAFPLRAIFKRQRNIQVVLGEVNEIDLGQRQVKVNETTYTYDYLIVATGAGTSYFGHDAWAEFAPGLKTIEEATAIRGRILSAFEKAEVENDPEKKAALLTFAIIGGGPTGVEMAGAIAELSRHTLKYDFLNINPSLARILLIEGNDRILPSYPPELSQQAVHYLKHLGVEVLSGHYVNDVRANQLTLRNNKSDIKVPAATIIWAAGVGVTSLGHALQQKYKLDSDRSGRIVVNNYCQIPGYDNAFVIGDLAHFKPDKGDPLPGIAAIAMQQGRYVAKYIIRSEKGLATDFFTYLDKGNLAVIGRKSAVAYRGKVKFTGIFAWLIWLFVHLLYLVGFENRILVAIQWAFNYFTFNRSARLITYTGSPSRS